MLCPCVLHALCQELGGLTEAWVGAVAAVRAAALGYLGGRPVIVITKANEFWKRGNLGRQPET